MTELQRSRILEILSYVKRQNNMRRQRVQFQEQIRRTQVEREAIEQAEAEDESLEAFLSTESDDLQDKTLCEQLLYHI